MKKYIVFILFTLFSGLQIYSIDIRQVMFGNNYENIEEISTFDFFKKYPDAKIFGIERLEKYGWKEKYYRLYKQEVCGKIFYRLLGSKEKLSDEYILNWRNPDVYSNFYRVQLFMEEGDYIIAILEPCVMNFDWTAWEHGTQKEYNMIEIIQRNNKLKGFLYNRLVDVIDHHTRIEESHRITEEYKNTANYFLFDDIIKNATEKCGMVKYVKDYSKIIKTKIRTDQPLVDDKRPFMYTVNNIFDGNHETAYVENTKDDLLFITVYNERYENISKIKLVNGYSSNYELYNDNSRVKAIGDYYINSESLNNEKDFYSDKSVEVRDLYRDPQILEWNDSIFAVTEIYKGKKYRDTCISELDFYDDVYGWFFGD